MYPNPQAALPLPPRPNVEHYRKLAKDLVKACKSSSSDADAAENAAGNAINTWVKRWLEALSKLQLDVPVSRRDVAHEITQQQAEVATFARQRLSGDRCKLTEAQFVIARAHGFLSWPKFVDHLESLAQDRSPTSAFEPAADAVITGDVATLTRLLREHPGLARRQSTREHQATLLHYVSANGVEGYRQVSPQNAAEITKILLDAGAEVDAAADVY